MEVSFFNVDRANENPGERRAAEAQAPAEER